MELDKLKDGVILTFERSESESSHEIEGDEEPHIDFDGSNSS